VPQILIEALSLQALHWPEALIRVGIALMFGFCLGYDRDQKSKPVDYRVYMIVAVTTCLLAIMGLELLERHDVEAKNVEFGLLRIVQGVVTGIGFLGAGAIIKSQDKQETIGTATGASIWGAGSMGLMLGFGFYGLALLGFIILAIILVIFGYFKQPLFEENDQQK
jgi:putative Mg2+ transporter-C (MgtC) family protein